MALTSFFVVFPSMIFWLIDASDSFLRTSLPELAHPTKAINTIKNNDFILDSNSKFYSLDWKYIETFKQNTKIYSSTTNKIYYINWEAYIFVDGHNNTSDLNFTLESGYLRATWLDSQINSIFDKDLSDESKVLKKSFEPKRNIFSWYIWQAWCICFNNNNLYRVRESWNYILWFFFFLFYVQTIT